MNIVIYTIGFIIAGLIHHLVIIFEIKFNPDMFRDIELFEFEKKMILKERNKNKK